MLDVETDDSIDLAFDHAGVQFAVLQFFRYEQFVEDAGSVGREVRSIDVGGRTFPRFPGL